MSQTHRERVGAVALVLVAFVALGLGSRTGGVPERSATLDDVARIQQHLATVEQELRLRDVSHLSPAQRAARRRAIARLQQYRNAGRFPHNHDFPNRRVPYFVDTHGTLCAMAYLIAESGHRELVDAVARARNNATVFELAADPTLGPALADWLARNGMTVEEAARVQPAYDGLSPGLGERRISTREVVGSGLLVGLGAISSVLNARGRGEWHGVTGLTAGGLAIGLGVSNLDQQGTERTLGLVDLAVGAVSMVLGYQRLAALSTEPAPVAAEEPRVQPRMVVSETGQPGMVLSIRF